MERRASREVRPSASAQAPLYGAGAPSSPSPPVGGAGLPPPSCRSAAGPSQKVPLIAVSVQGNCEHHGQDGEMHLRNQTDATEYRIRIISTKRAAPWPRLLGNRRRRRPG